MVDVLWRMAAACTCQNTSQMSHNTAQYEWVFKSDGAMRFSLSSQKVMNYSESAKTLC